MLADAEAAVDVRLGGGKESVMGLARRGMVLQNPASSVTGVAVCEGTTVVRLGGGDVGLGWWVIWCVNIGRSSRDGDVAALLFTTIEGNSSS